MATVLVIDDDEAILQVTSAILAKKNYTPLTARTTQEALPFLKSSKIDAILLDIILPGQGGMEFLMDIKKDYPGIPVIIMSGKVRTDRDAFKKLAQQFGAVCILAKPFTGNELLDELAGIFSHTCNGSL